MGLFEEMSGMFSGFQKFHDESDGPNAGNVEDFGKPAYSLYTAVNILDLHNRTDITDEQGNLKYYSKSKIISFTAETDIMDANDNVIAHLKKEPFSFTEKYYITMADGRRFTFTNELFHITKDITNIEELGWQLQGNIIGLNFNLKDQNGEPVATIGRKMVSMHEKYCIDLYKPEHEQLVVAILIQLEVMIRFRNNNNDISSDTIDI